MEVWRSPLLIAIPTCGNSKLHAGHFSDHPYGKICPRKTCGWRSEQSKFKTFVKLRGKVTNLYRERKIVVIKT